MARKRYDERKALRRHPGYEPSEPPPVDVDPKRTPTERPNPITAGTRPVHPRFRTKDEPPPAKPEEPKPEEAKTEEPAPEKRKTERPKPEAPRARSAPTPSEEAKVDEQGMARIENLLASSDWSRVADLLGKTDPDKLPPRDALLYALARHESGGDADANAMTRLAITSVARLLDVRESSEVALVVAKRLLRKTPVSWARRPAPPARVSVLIILVVLVLSGALGWFLSSTHVKWHLW
jgi:hypothetical protein